MSLPITQPTASKHLKSSEYSKQKTIHRLAERLLHEYAQNITQILTGIEVFSEICFPWVGKCYPRSKTKGNISQLRENKFH